MPIGACCRTRLTVRQSDRSQLDRAVHTHRVVGATVREPPVGHLPTQRQVASHSSGVQDRYYTGGNTVHYTRRTAMTFVTGVEVTLQLLNAKLTVVQSQPRIATYRATLCIPSAQSSGSLYSFIYRRLW